MLPTSTCDYVCIIPSSPLCYPVSSEEQDGLALQSSTVRLFASINADTQLLKTLQLFIYPLFISVSEEQWLAITHLS